VPGHALLWLTRLNGKERKEKAHISNLFKTAIDMMPCDTHKIVLHADKTPAGEHVRRFNAPTIDEVAIVIVGDQGLLQGSEI
jgi:hypothetical protein